MKTEFVIMLCSILFAALLGLVGYWLRAVYIEFKALIKELTIYTNQLQNLIVGIQTQIDKSIEEDIKELKTEVRDLRKLTNQQENRLSSLKNPETAHE